MGEKASLFRAERADGIARTVLVSCRLIPAGAQSVTEMAKKQGIPRAELIRRALQLYVKKYQEATNA